MDDLFWLLLGGLALWSGLACFAPLQRRRFPFGLFFAAIFGYLGFRNTWLRSAGPDLQAAWWSLIFPAAAPLLSWFGRNHGHRLRMLLGRLVLVLSIWVLSIVCWVYLFDQITSLGLLSASLVAVCPLLPLRRLLTSLQSLWRHWSAARARRREAKAQARVNAEEIGGFQECPPINDLKDQLRQQEHRLAVLESQTREGERRLQVLRADLSAQVRQIRAAEVKALRSGDEVLRVNPHLGFLMLEVARTLRAEIRSGERQPAIEHDSFFFQVTADLLSTDDFEARYLHQKGRAAVTALNSYLAGDQPLNNVERQVRSLNFGLHELAPSPIRGDLVSMLLEAWLVPHRRRQRREHEEFVAGTHRFQQALEAFLHDPDLQLDPELWAESWDALPGIFVTGTAPASVLQSEESDAPRTNSCTSAGSAASEVSASWLAGG